MLTDRTYDEQNLKNSWLQVFVESVTQKGQGSKDCLLRAILSLSLFCFEGQSTTSTPNTPSNPTMSTALTTLPLPPLPLLPPLSPLPPAPSPHSSLCLSRPANALFKSVMFAAPCSSSSLSCPSHYCPCPRPIIRPSSHSSSFSTPSSNINCAALIPAIILALILKPTSAISISLRLVGF